MAKTKQKRYKIRGKVAKVYDAREVEVYGKTKEVTDIDLKLENGKKIKVSFWDQDVDGIEGCKVLITYVIDKGEYKGKKQYSSTRDTEVEVLEKASGDEEEEAEEQEDEQEEVGEPEDDEEKEEKPKKIGKVKKTKKPLKDKVDAGVVSLVQALAETAWTICEETAPEHVKNSAEAYRAYFGNVFTTLGTKDYYAKQ